MNFTRKTIIREAATASPEHAAKMQEYGLHCVYCPVAGSETIEDGCKAHGLSEEQIDSLIKELNEIKKENLKKN
jgi:hybrid cluster-associated redox disulfide protein